MSTMCNGCDKQFQDGDVAPYQRNPDGTYAFACRKCVGAWITLGALWATLPFWARKQGLDTV